MDIKLVSEISSSEYLELIESIGWKSYTNEQVDRAIKNSMFIIKAVIDGKCVGMGRLIGDFGTHGMLTDIIVRPEYQGHGIGKMIVMYLKESLINSLKEGERFLIELCPMAGKTDFYVKCGFKHKPEVLEGMYLFVEK